MYGYFLWSGIITVALPVIAGIYALAAWDSLFVTFHRLLFNNDGTVYLVTGNGVGRGVYSADELVISIVFPGSDIPQVYVATFTRLDKYTYLHLMPDISGREALVFGAMSQR